LESYFLKGKQKVLIGNDYSNYANIAIIVPQGTMLGILLFLIYINDIFKIINSGKTLLCKYKPCSKLERCHIYMWI